MCLFVTLIWIKALVRPFVTRIVVVKYIKHTSEKLQHTHAFIEHTLQTHAHRVNHTNISYGTIELSIISHQNKVNANKSN